MFSLEYITSSLQNFLSERCSPAMVTFSELVIVGILVLTLFAFLGLVLVYMERKVSAFMQIRLGPNRVGYRGTAQTLADTIKLVVKEGLIPDGADKTFAEMSMEEKNKYSHRRIATDKLIAFLQNQQ